MAFTEQYVILCDDFRREDNGKILVVGMYVTDMNVPNLPFRVPTLCFFCILESDRPGTTPFSFRLEHQDTGQSIAQGMGQAQVVDPHLPVVMPIKIGGFQFNGAGLYTFSLEFQGNAPIVKTFNVNLTIPGATPQPPRMPH